MLDQQYYVVKCHIVQCSSVAVSTSYLAETRKSQLAGDLQALTAGQVSNLQDIPAGTGTLDKYGHCLACGHFYYEYYVYK